MTGNDSPCLLMVAGEASGDLHGATLAKALGRQARGWRLVGMGGPQMAAAGVQLLADPTRHAVVGGTEALSRLPQLFRMFRLLVRRLRAERPRALILIDFPEFNVLLARVAKQFRVPVVYFIPPQVWAWRLGRARLLGKLAARILTVFPFERPIYEAVGARVEFVGHPLLDVVPEKPDRRDARASLGVPTDGILVGLLPGSRREEVKRLLPVMVDAAQRIGQRVDGVRFLVAPAPTVEPLLMDRLLSGAPLPLTPVRGHTYDVMAAADVLIVASGTATLEAALIGTPMVVCYLVSRVSELMVRLLIRIPWVSLPNVVAGRPVVPELLLGDVSGPRLADAALALLEDPDRLRAQRFAFEQLKGTLGTPGVGERAARHVLEVAGYGL